MAPLQTRMTHKARNRSKIYKAMANEPQVAPKSSLECNDVRNY